MGAPSGNDRFWLTPAVQLSEAACCCRKIAACHKGQANQGGRLLSSFMQPLICLMMG
jgi:hypothetical protein